MNPKQLLDQCVKELDAGAGSDSPALLSGLEQWSASLDQPSIDQFTQELVDAPLEQWPALIDQHPAHRHSWYEVLAAALDCQQWAEFLWENTAFPGFIPLLERLHASQFLPQAKAAIERNLADEKVPAPHQALMRRLMLAVKRRAPGELKLGVLPSNTQRTLVFYYGCFCDPWHLVGSLYATESMAYHRINRMGAGLRRIGLTDHELAFISIHSECDEQHAREWLDEVMRPSIRERAALRSQIAHGIASCLCTSLAYLDDLVTRHCQGKPGVRSSFYGDGARYFQECFDSRRLADHASHKVVHDHLSTEDRDFVAGRDFLFLATCDRRGQPQCSYKGGSAGFVRVLDERTIAFPLYDGNGMFLSAGNIQETRRLGLLFVDFENPRRLRVNGIATIASSDPLLAEYHEAMLIVRVQVDEVFTNCPRYVHSYRRRKTSPYIPRPDRPTPVPDWKQRPAMRDVLPRENPG